MKTLKHLWLGKRRGMEGMKEHERTNTSINNLLSDPPHQEFCARNPNQVLEESKTYAGIVHIHGNRQDNGSTLTHKRQLWFQLG